MAQSYTHLCGAPAARPAGNGAGSAGAIAGFSRLRLFISFMLSSCNFARARSGAARASFRSRSRCWHVSLAPLRLPGLCGAPSCAAAAARDIRIIKKTTVPDLGTSKIPTPKAQNFWCDSRMERVRGAELPTSVRCACSSLRRQWRRLRRRHCWLQSFEILH